MASDGIGWLTPDNDGSAVVECRRLALPSFLWAYFNWAFGELTKPENWVVFGDMPIADVTTVFQDAFDEMEKCEAMIGSIVPLVTNVFPANVLLCDGGTHLKADYPELYNALDPFYIIDADTFTVPDLRQRFLIGSGNKPSLTVRAIGETGGEENHLLTEAELARHSHDYVPPSVTVDMRTVGAPNVTLAIAGALAPTTETGQNQPHNNMPPFAVVTWGIIAK